jgi:amino acid transporter
MIAFVATLIGYIYTQVTGSTLSNPVLVGIAVLFAILTGYIASRGVTGSTLTASVINVVQLITLVGFSAFAVAYRHTNPGGNNAWTFSSAWDVVRPHSVTGVLMQSTLAILILVGFESCTALAAETKNARRNIPRAVILSLVVQGLFAYLLEYFAAGYMMSDQLVATGADKKIVTGLAAAGVSSAPMGDLAILLGNRLLNGIGFGLMISIAVTVVLALIGTTLSCLNTAARVTYAMSKDQELPEILGLLHGKYATPARSIWVLIAVSCIIAAIGLQSVVGLTGITLASNFGTFLLYGLTCLWTVIAYGGARGSHLVKHRVVPWLGLVANLLMLASILYLYVIGSADAKKEAYICFGIAGAWAVVSLIYVLLRKPNRPAVTPAARAIG